MGFMTGDIRSEVACGKAYNRGVSAIWIHRRFWSEEPAIQLISWTKFCSSAKNCASIILLEWMTHSRGRRLLWRLRQPVF